MILNVIIQCIIIVIVYFSFIYLLSRIDGRVDIVDTSFGIGFIVISIYFLIYNMLLNPGLPRKIIVTILVLIWGLRLSFHIYIRNKNKPSDRRYQEIISKWSSYIEIKKYIFLFLSQGIAVLLILSSVIFINIESITSLGIFDFIGIFIWILGFLFESISDSQLRKFISNSDNNGKIMTSGLWKYTRHPNYFGEITQWVGIFVIALSVKYGYIFVISPIVIYILLNYISGIPLIEKNYASKIGWEDYKRKTSRLLPLPQRNINKD
jgi:steroid 5-alpha reductase family enzyme